MLYVGMEATRKPSSCLEKMTTCIQQRAAVIHGKIKVQHIGNVFVFSVWCRLLGHYSSVLESSYFSLVSLIFISPESETFALSLQSHLPIR